jgi:hypothetical protein
MAFNRADHRINISHDNIAAYHLSLPSIGLGDWGGEDITGVAKGWASLLHKDVDLSESQVKCWYKAFLAAKMSSLAPCTKRYQGIRKTSETKTYTLVPRRADP